MMRFSILTEENVTFLKNITLAVLEASTVKPGQELRGLGPNRLGISFIRPGGRECYPSFWTRDFVMSLESGLIREEQAKAMFFCLAEHQAENELFSVVTLRVVTLKLPIHLSKRFLFFPVFSILLKLPQEKKKSFHRINLDNREKTCYSLELCIPIIEYKDKKT